jgi:HEAT repeat protein
MNTRHLIRPVRPLVAAVLVGALLCPTVTTAAPGRAPRAKSQAATTSVADAAAAIIAEGRVALKAGRTEEAISAADRALQSVPGHREATSLKIDALVAVPRLSDAYDVYDAFLRVTKRDDTALLQPLSIATLQALTSSQNAEARIGALGILAEHGRKAARDDLGRTVESKSDSYAAQLAVSELARLGDQAGLKRLRALAATAASPMDRLSALDSLAAIDPVAAGAGYSSLLKDKNPGVLFAAVRGVGRCRTVRAIPRLRDLLAAPILGLQVRAAASLIEMGDTTGLPTLEANLSAEVAELRLMAAAGLRAHRDPRWVEAVRPILENRDLFYRVEAAEMLLKATPAEALRTLIDALKDPNPIVREQAAKVLAAQPAPSVSALRPLLRDQAPTVRRRAAAGILRASQTAAGTKPPEYRQQPRPNPAPAQD